MPELTAVAKATRQGLDAIAAARTRAEESERIDLVAKEVAKAVEAMRPAQSNDQYAYDEDKGLVPAGDVSKATNPEMHHVIHKRGDWENDERVKRVQDWNDACYIASKAMNVDVRHTKLYKDGIGEVSELGKALNTGTASHGGDWVPTDLSAQVIDILERNLVVATLFQSIDMPTQPFEIPQKTARSTTYYVNESTSDNPNLFRASQPTVGKLTLTAKKFANRVNLSDELTEDGIVAMLPLIREDIATSQARAVEDTLINGDTTATHQDSDVTGVDDVRKSISGIRKLINTAAKYDVDEDGSGSLDIEDFRNARKLMTNTAGAAIYGADTAGLSWLTSIHGGLKMMNALKDYVTTIDKFGESRATILKGTLGAVDGIPLLTSEFVRVNLNASGVYDASVTTKTVVIIVNGSAGIIGKRRGLKIEQDRVIGADQNLLVSTQRWDFQPRYPTAENTFGLLRDITA
jgi:HK97 family phage major capsid protein